MKKIALILLGLILSNTVIAADNNNKESLSSIYHRVDLAGLRSDEGRFIRTDIYENNKFQSGYYFCATGNSVIYDVNYFFSKSKQPFHLEHLIRVSICQDGTLADCQEIATDKYITFRSLDGYLQNDSSHNTVDLSPLKSVYQPCEPSPMMDDMVKKSIHLSDRVYAHIG